MPDRPAAASLLDELQQTRPFRSDAQEAALALLRTASVVARRFARVVEPTGLSLAQYNVLRILRGAGPDGLPTLAIRDRMIDEGSTVTRLLDKLERAGYVSRDRDRPDRRQVLCRIAPKGSELLATLDPVVDAADESATGMLSPEERRTLIALLGAIRAPQPSDSR
ncbi:MAG: MarR family transcriptional regulator [Gemmatimonadetes bacterium]|nr:MarR family transcriptional regulator [Gemmatimonadota bacterium]